MNRSFSQCKATREGLYLGGGGGVAYNQKEFSVTRLMGQ